MAHSASRLVRSARWFAALTLGCALAGTGARPSAAQSDLVTLLSAVVAVEAYVPTDARTAGVLGSERLGSGIVIDGAGLVVTIGYLILEATDTWIPHG